MPRGPLGPIPGEVEAPLAGYSGLQANGRAGSGSLHPGEFDPHELPILHGNPYAPATDSQGRADCQGGQNGYVLSGAPQYRLPGQASNNPAFGISNFPGNRGPTFAGREREPEKLKPRPLP